MEIIELNYKKPNKKKSIDERWSSLIDEDGFHPPIRPKFKVIDYDFHFDKFNIEMQEPPLPPPIAPKALKRKSFLQRIFGW